MNMPDELLDMGVEFIGFIELLIGLSTMLFVSLFHIFSIIEKPLGVFIFVMASAFISAAIGFGILNYKNWARILLVFFSGYVVILKILIYLGVMKFTGEIIISPPSYVKDLISILYHILILVFFTNNNIVSRFKAS